MPKASAEITKAAEEIAKEGEEIIKEAEEIAETAEEIAKVCAEIVKPAQEIAKNSAEIARSSAEFGETQMPTLASPSLTLLLWIHRTVIFYFTNPMEWNHNLSVHMQGHYLVIYLFLFQQVHMPLAGWINTRKDCCCLLQIKK